MEPRDVVVVGGSAGSLEPLRALIAALPADLPGTVLVTQHVGEHARSELPWLGCHVGHQFGPQSLAAAQADTAEAKLWAAVATLEETAALARHLAAHTGPGRGDADQQASTANWATRLAESLRAQVAEGRPPGDGEAVGGGQI
jgi:CheB methylesterase